METPPNENNQDQILNNEVDLATVIPEEEELEKAIDTNCCLRWFGPIRAGSLRGSIFAMGSIVFGSGCLAFPYAVSICGPIVGLICFLITGLISLYTMNILLVSGVRKNIMDYNGLIEATVGHKFVVFSDINNLILCFGVIMSYQLTIYTFSLNLGHFFFAIDPLDSINKIILQSFCMVCIQMPLSLLKNIATLQYASMVGTVALLYSIVVVIVEMPFYLKGYLKENTIKLFRPITWNYLDTFTTFLFGFSSHNGIFQVLSELHNPTKPRYKTILYRSFYVECFLYLLMSFGGYFSTFEDTKGVFLERDDLDGFNDYFVKIAKFTLIVCLHCTMAVNYNIMRMSISSMFFNGKTIPFWTDFTITFVVYVLSNVGVFFIKELVQIFGIIGGCCAVVISFVNPVCVYVQSNPYSKCHIKNIFPVVMLVIVVVLGMGSTVLSIMKFFN